MSPTPDPKRNTQHYVCITWMIPVGRQFSMTIPMFPQGPGFLSKGLWSWDSISLMSERFRAWPQSHLLCDQGKEARDTRPTPRRMRFASWVIFLFFGGHDGHMCRQAIEASGLLIWGFFLEAAALLHAQVTFGFHSITPWGWGLGKLVLGRCSGWFCLE